jgi:hypothetical protein
MNEIVKSSAFDVELNAENLQRLADWVANFATPEELAWNNDKFKDLRNLLKVQKAAQSLRIEAVRLECVALRRVGQANLHGKLTGHDARVAKWLANMSEDEFGKLLEDSDNEVSPISLMRFREGQEQRLGSYIRGSGDFDPDYDISVYGLEWEAKNILRSMEQFDSFTVEQAATALLERLTEKWDCIDLPREFAETPLREVVRGVLRMPEPGKDLVRVGDVVTYLPSFVTYCDSQSTWQRIPWKRAQVMHFRAMVETRELQARQLQDKAAEMRALLDAIDIASEAESESVDGAFVRCVQQGRAARWDI